MDMTRFFCYKRQEDVSVYDILLFKKILLIYIKSDILFSLK